MVRRAQMAATALNRLEHGVQSVYAERLATLARVLDVSIDYLLGLQDTPALLGAIPVPVPERGVSAGG
jgi:transcriptional regulator with XRE-family HTH domain